MPAAASVWRGGCLGRSCGFSGQVLANGTDLGGQIGVNVAHLKRQHERGIGKHIGAKSLRCVSKTSKIGVLATPSTLKGDKYQDLVNELASKKEVKIYEQACIGLVEQIEKGEINSEKTFKMLNNWLKPMKDEGVDTIVLGCTHYPLVDSIIKKIMNKDINLIETGNAIANRLLVLSSQKKHKNEGTLNISVCYTGKINTKMIEIILENKNIEVRNCGI